VQVDVHLLAKEGIKVRGVVDTGTIMALVDPALAKYGAAGQIQTLWGEGHHQAWRFSFMFDYRNQKLRLENQRHSSQDVLTPFAVAFRAGISEANQRLYGSNDDIFPIVNEAIELCYSKSPVDIRHPTDGLMKRQAFLNWHPQKEDSKFGLNGRLRCQTIRRARGDFVEPYEDERSGQKRSLAERQKVAIEIYEKRFGSSASLPKSDDFRRAKLHIPMASWCQNCAAKDHAYDKCKEDKVPCDYPHGPGFVHSPHSLLMCPALHSACHDCKIRGHEDEDHRAGLRRSPMQLRQQFLVHAHRGLFTSIPFLYGHVALLPYHWTAGLGYARLGRNTTDLWTYAGLGARIPGELLEANRTALEQAQKNCDSTVWTYAPPKVNN
jgi:hypothetical protein